MCGPMAQRAGAAWSQHWWLLCQVRLRFCFPRAVAFREDMESNRYIFPYIILPQIQLFLSILQSSLGVICPSQAQL